MVNLDNLFFRIKELNITAKKLSDDTGISSGNISDWKSGRSMPTALKLVILADYLGCSIDYLLGRTDDPESHIDKFAFLDERDHELVSSIIEKSYARSHSDVDTTSVHELPRFKAVAHGGDIIVNEPFETPKIPD